MPLGDLSVLQNNAMIDHQFIGLKKDLTMCDITLIDFLDGVIEHVMEHFL